MRIEELQLKFPGIVPKTPPPTNTPVPASFKVEKK
jgi:hypothetical protein